MLSSPLRTSLAYAALAAGWIFASDLMLALWRGGRVLPVPLETAKGLAFVAVTALALFALLSARERRLRWSSEQAAASEGRLQGYAEHAPIGLLLFDERGHLLQVNPRAQALSGAAQPGAHFTALLGVQVPPLSRWWRRLRRDGRCSFEAALPESDRWVAVQVGRMQDGHVVAYVEDITERRREDIGLRQAQVVFHSISEGLVVADPRGNIEAVNAAFCRITGYREDELLGRNLRLINSGRQDTAFYQEFWHALQTHGRWQGEIWNRRKSGEVYPEWLSIDAVRDPQGRLLNYVAACNDLTESKRSALELQRLSQRDSLTGLMNRSLLLATLEHAVARARRDHRKGAVLLLDLDRFKTVNDSLGHREGDRLLQEVARRLVRRLREADTLARLGGDEFCVVLENLERCDDAAHVAQALIEACSVPIELDGGRQVYVGASVGISLFPDDGVLGDRLLQQADAALYLAKDEGRGTYRYFTDSLTREAKARLELESGLRQGLARGEFTLHYQPLVDAQTGAVQGLEALMRWTSPTHGPVSPAEFIPVAEETGLIVPLGEWVLHTACAQMAEWERQGLAPHTIAVNLSPRQFELPDLHERVRAILHDTGWPAGRLELEITETALLDGEESIEQLRRLKALGVKLAVDDFGTGYSSLSYLSRFPLDQLKVDQSFVRRLGEDDNAREIAAAVIALGNSLKLQVLAEGVETDAQWQFLRRQGCSLLQGYRFARPMPVAQLEGWLAEHVPEIITLA